MSEVKGSAFSFGANKLFYVVTDLGARTTKSAAENTAAIIAALDAIDAAGGGVLVVPQGISHTFDPATQFPVTANYLTVLQWTGGTYKSWCNQTSSTEFDGDVLVNNNLQVVGPSKLYGQVAISKLMLVPVAAQSIQIPSNISKLILYPAGTLATLTVVMPQTPVDGQVESIYTDQILTALTVSPYAGQTIVGAVTTLAAKGSVEYTYNQTLNGTFTANTWYRTR